MHKLTPVQKLDLVLNCLKKEKEYNTLENIYKSINPTDMYSEIYTYDEISRILKKLVTDNLVYEIDRDDDIEYCVTFEGYLDDGYEAKASKDAIDALLNQTEIDRRRTLDALLATNSTRLNVLTGWLTFGTVVAALAALGLLGWQVYSF